MRFSASIANDCGPDYFLKCVAAVERLGYDALLVGDEGLGRNTHALLALAAEHTDEIELGTGVTNPFTRNPAMTAAAMATLQEHSGGRAMLGLGAGSPIVLDPLGCDQSDPVGTVRDATKAIRRLVAGETVTIDAPTFTLDGASLDFVPEEEVPIYVAGRGPGLLGLGGYRADGVLAGAGLASAEGMAYAFECIADGAAKRGRDVEEIDVVCWAWLSVADDRDAALEGVAPLAAKIVNKAPMRALEAIGIDRTDAEPVKALDDVGARSADSLREVLPDPVIEQFAVAGTPAECAAHVDRLADAGVDHLGLLAFDNPEQERLGSLEAFADAVVNA